jgi:oligopeptide/dipeptide ABC transporter ATP-binding protein
VAALPPPVAELSEPLLRVRDLTVEFRLARGTLRAVDGASFDVHPGEALGIVGESGSGKTMALRALLGLLPRAARITGGSVEFEGTDLLRVGEERRRALRGTSIAMVFQEPMTALNPVIRVGDQIAESPLVRLGLGRRAARARALELMRLVGIPDPQRRAEAYPHELSGGMRQRVMIAIALSADPKLILCDEPTTALDVTIQDQILRLLRSLQETLQVSLVFVSHDLAVIAQTCRRVAVMYAGQVVEVGEVGPLFREPRHPYTLGLLRSVPDFDAVRATLTSIPGSPPDLARLPVGCRFQPRCPFATEECVAGPIPLIEIDADRAARCLHHEQCAVDARREPVVAGV